MIHITFESKVIEMRKFIGITQVCSLPCFYMNLIYVYSSFSSI